MCVGNSTCRGSGIEVAECNVQNCMTGRYSMSGGYSMTGRYSMSGGYSMTGRYSMSGGEVLVVPTGQWR